MPSATAGFGVAGRIRMSGTPSKPADVLQCPVCEGRGELSKKVLLERLSENDLANKVKSYLSDFVEADHKEEKPGMPTAEAVKHDAKAWNLTHFLWRRSLKD
jgi:hypothetical protein